MIDAFSAEQVEAFDRDGFLIVEEGLVSPRALDLLRERYEPLFEGVYETGIKPDEVELGARAAIRRTAPGRSATAGGPTT